MLILMPVLAFVVETIFMHSEKLLITTSVTATNASKNSTMQRNVKTYDQNPEPTQDRDRLRSSRAKWKTHF